MLSGRSLSPERLHDARATLIAEARAELPGTPSRVRVRHELRYRGQSFELAVDEEIEPRALEPADRRSSGLDPDELRAAFARVHELRYGYRDDAEVELVNMRVSVWGASPSLRPRPASTEVPTTDVRPVVFDGEPVEATVLRGELAPGTFISGAALCALPEATLLIPPGWSGEVDEYGTIRLIAVNG
jgi:N-methylhydantoinase A